MFAASSRLPGMYLEEDLFSFSASDYSIGPCFLYCLFSDIKTELADVLLSVGSWTAVTLLHFGNPDYQVADPQVESEHALEVMDLEHLPSVESETGKLFDAHVPLLVSPSSCSVGVRDQKLKPRLPTELDVFLDNTTMFGDSSFGSKIKARSISFGVPRDPFEVYGKFRPPDPTTFDTPTRWNSWVSP